MAPGAGAASTQGSGAGWIVAVSPVDGASLPPQVAKADVALVPLVALQLKTDVRGSEID